jgi:thioredoxin-like negative regulator of GroEL
MAPPPPPDRRPRRDGERRGTPPGRRAGGDARRGERRQGDERRTFDGRAGRDDPDARGRARGDGRGERRGDGRGGQRGDDDRSASAARRADRDRREERAPRSWGGVARRGTRELADAEPGSAADAWRKAVERSGRRPPWEPERWERDPDAPADATRGGRPPRRGAPGRRDPATPSPPSSRRRKPAESGARPDATARKRPARKAPEPIAAELAHVAGPRRAPRLEQRLMDAARAYERERYADARRMVSRLAEEAPASAAVRELHGLALYRLGKWRDAVKELEAYRTLTGTVDQHPVLADSYRALKKYRRVDELWDELRAASPGAELVAEGRIVAAGALADQGRIDEAIALLERGRLTSKRPREHHLRLWYALADLYERAGDVPRARELFRRIADHERDFADTAERLSALD